MKNTNLIFTTLMACILFFTACKKEEEYVVSFNPNGGTGVMVSQTFTAGKPQVLMPNTFTYSGYTFTGWNTEPAGTGTAYQDGEDVFVSKNMVLFAQWAVVDLDGNIYKTVKIGTQLWLKENLKTTKYQTGESIPIIIDAGDWENCTTAAMCYYDYNVANAPKYGALYNGYTVGAGNLCPEGWHVSTNADWHILANYLGGYEVTGHKLKTDYDWKDSPTGSGNGNNESGFSALPAGRCDMSGTFSGEFGTSLGMMTAFWSAEGDMKALVYTGKELLYNLEIPINTGYSLRCVKD